MRASQGIVAKAGNGSIAKGQPVRLSGMGDRAALITACPLDCPDTCTLEVTVEDGRLVGVDVAPIDTPGVNPVTAGFICQKVRRSVPRVHGPQRLLTPLIRSGPKGSGEFRTASWEEALDLVAARMSAAISGNGPAAIVPYAYNSSTGVLASGGLSALLFERLGVSDVLHTICAATAGRAWWSVFGDMLSADPRSVVDARLVVIWGANPAISNTHFPPLVEQARRSTGARVVVVDPRRTATAARADLHLAIRPGTDVVAAMAMARHLRHVGLVAQSFLDAHVDGTDEYLDACEEWALDRAAEVCGVSAADLATAAEWWATERPAFLRLGWGLERNRNGGSACRAVLALPLLVGQFGEAGSGVMASLSAAARSAWDGRALRAAVLGSRDPGDGSPPRRRSINMNQLGALLCDATLEPPITVLFVQGANPAVMNPDQTAVLRGLARDDLFTVVHEQVLTDTALMADVVLPATTHFEADDVASSYGTFHLQAMPAVIDRVGESRTNDEVAAALAVRLLGAEPAMVAAFDPTPGRLLGLALRQPPGELRAAGATVQFRDTVPSHEGGRARLFDPLLDVADRLPRYREPDTRYPLVLLSPATNRTINSMLGELQAAAAVVTMHPDDAAVRGVGNGDLVRVWNDQATIELPARVADDVRPGVVVIPKGLWRKDVRGGLTANALAPATLNDLAGGASFNDARVEIARAPAPAPAHDPGDPGDPGRAPLDPTPNRPAPHRRPDGQRAG